MSDNTLDWSQWQIVSTPSTDSVPQDRSTPTDSAVASADDAANAAIAAGQDPDTVQQQLVARLSKIQDQPKSSPSTPSNTLDWSKWTVVSRPDSDIDADQAAQQVGYNPAPDYNSVALSPVDRNWQANHPGADPTIPNATPPQVQRAMDADQAGQPPPDMRRDVGAGEGAWRGANEMASGILGTLSGAAAFIGYPLTAADDFLSGRPVKSVTDTVVNAEQPLDAEQHAYAIDPNKENLTLAGQVGYGLGQAGVQLPVMMASAPAEAVATAADAAAPIAEKIATHIFKTAQVSSLPAASQARDAAQQTIDNGGTPADAMSAAVQSYAQTVAFNTLPLGAKGGAVTRTVTGGAMGAAQAAASGGDSQQIISGSILGAATAGLMGERAEPVSASDRAASRARKLADSVIGDQPVTGDEASALAQGAAVADAATPDVVKDTTDVGDQTTPDENPSQLADRDLTSEPAPADNQPLTITPAEIRQHASDTIQELSQNESRSPGEDALMAFLSQNLDNPQAIADQYGIQLARPESAGISTPVAGEGASGKSGVPTESSDGLSADVYPRPANEAADSATKQASIDAAYALRAQQLDAERAAQLDQAQPDIQEARLQQEFIKARALGMEDEPYPTAMQLAFQTARGDEPVKFSRDEDQTPGISVEDFDSLPEDQRTQILQMLADQQAGLDANADPLTEGFKILAQNEGLFRNKPLPGKTPSELAKQAGGVTYLGQQEHEGELAHAFRVDQQGAEPATAYMLDRPGGVQLDLSRLTSGGGAGEKMYNIADSFARNNGKQFAEDESGLSDNAMYRRPIHEASGMLKAGSAEHIANGDFLASQRPGGPQTRPIKPDAARRLDPSLRERLLTMYHNTRLAVPEIDNYAYDTAQRSFIDSRTGAKVGDDEFKRLAGDRRANPVRQAMVRVADSDKGQSLAPPPVGRDTIKAGILAGTLLRTKPSDRASTLAALRVLGGSELEPSGLRGIMPSAGETGAGVTPEVAHDAVKRELGSAGVNRLIQRGKLEITDSATAQARGDFKGLSPDQARGVKALFNPKSGRVTILHDRVSADQIPGLLRHEFIHAHLKGLLGDDRFQSLLNRMSALRGRDKDIQAAFDRVPNGTPKADTKEEAMAYLSQAKPDHPIAQKMLDSAKLFLNRLGMPLDWINGHAAAIRKIAELNLKHAALDGEVRADNGNVMYAAGGDGSAPDPFMRRVLQARGMNPDAVAQERNPGREDIAPQGTKQAENNPVGIKNAYKAQERTERGQTPLDAEGRRSFGQVWDTAAQRLQDDPGLGARLAADVAGNSRPLSAEDSATLIQYGTQLRNRYDQALRDHDAALKSGDDNAAIEAKVRTREIEDLLATHDVAARNAGYEQGLGLAARKMMAARDYSLATQIMRFRSIEGGEVPKAVADRLKAATDKIADLQRQIDERDAATQQRASRFRPAGKTLDDQYASLRAKLAQIAGKPEAQAQFSRDDDIRGIIRAMAQNRVAAGETNAQRLVDAIHADVAQHGFDRDDVARTIAGIAEHAKHTKTELQQRMAQIKKDLRAEFNKPEERRNAQRQAQLRKQMDDLKQRIATGDFSKEKREPIHYNEDTFALEAQRDGLQRKIDSMAMQRERANMSSSARLADFIVRLHRAAILTSVNTLGKLSWAALSRIAVTPTEELIGSGLKHIPGISQIAAKAPREGAGFNLGTELGALRNTVKPQEIWRVLTTGEDNLTRLYSGKPEYPNDWMNLIGHIHGAIKESAKQNEFFRAFSHRAQFERNRVIGQGMSPDEAEEYMQRPSTQAMIGAQAYVDAQRAVLQSDTMATKLMAMSKHYLHNAGEEGSAGRATGVALEKALNFFLPIVKVPVNFAGELSSYAFGGAKAALALRRGIESLTPDQADYVMRNLKKQTLGGALLALGMMAGPSMFGGFYQTGDAKKHRPVKAEEANVSALGGHFNRLWFDSPALDAIQVGATLRRVYDNEYRKYGKGTASADAMYHAIGGMLGKLPFLDEPSRLFEAARTPTTAAKYAGGMVRDTVIPIAVQQYARHQDNDRYRKPKTFSQVIESGLPQTPLNLQFNREHVPTH